MRVAQRTRSERTGEHFMVSLGYLLKPPRGGSKEPVSRHTVEGNRLLHSLMVAFFSLFKP